MADLLRRWSWTVIFALILIDLCGCSKPEESSVITGFFEARKSGDFASAYEILSQDSKNLFTKEQFENYCFVFRVIEYAEAEKKDGYFVVNYTYYDKKFNKVTGELYTYYITQNVENIRVENGKIVFPHTGFILVRKFIEEKKTDEAGNIFRKMLSVDRNNPDVKKSASLMGFDTEIGK